MAEPNATTIAILGATSHIAKGLIVNCINAGYRLHLYSRSIITLVKFIEYIGKSNNPQIYLYEGYEDFLKHKCTAIINCVGVGTSNKINGEYSRYFSVTEQFDNLAINYLRTYPSTYYFSLSSGVVYGQSGNEPFTSDTKSYFNVNNIEIKDYYSIARINAEAKHRSHSSLNIIDLRIFSYFSQFADLEEPYLVNEMVKSVLDSEIFITNENDVIRDFLHHEDLFGVIQCCLQQKSINQALDMVSRAPISKFELLEIFKSKYHLDYVVEEGFNPQFIATGIKNMYCSINDNLKLIGYSIKYSSIEAIINAVDILITNSGKYVGDN